jgi:hypothetical protein
MRYEVCGDGHFNQYAMHRISDRNSVRIEEHSLSKTEPVL